MRNREAAGSIQDQPHHALLAAVDKQDDGTGEIPVGRTWRSYKDTANRRQIGTLSRSDRPESGQSKAA